MPAEPTDADRDRATGLMAVAITYPTQREALAHAIAQALADERERARAPFLALADQFDDGRNPDSIWTATARLIRRAAEDPK